MNKDGETSGGVGDNKDEMGTNCEVRGTDEVEAVEEDNNEDDITEDMVEVKKNKLGDFGCSRMRYAFSWLQRV